MDQKKRLRIEQTNKPIQKNTHNDSFDQCKEKEERKKEWHKKKTGQQQQQQLTYIHSVYLANIHVDIGAKLCQRMYC